MKIYFLKKLLVLFLIVCPVVFVRAQADGKSIIEKAELNTRGKSSYMETNMEIIRPKWTRSVQFKSWSSESNYGLVFITGPAKEKGQSFLKRNMEVWSWSPAIRRTIKIPPSMMLQGWMGSDYTNDDLLKASSVVDDYTHKLLGEETVDGKRCYKIELKPKDGAAIVWGMLLKWVSKDQLVAVKTEYYDELGELVKTEIASNIKTISGRNMPSKLELIPADKSGSKTIITYSNMKFDIPLGTEIFTQQYMQRVK